MATAFEPKRAQHTFVFVFPLAAGHVNPSLPVARALVQQGHAVHYLSHEQFREAIEDTGAVWHSTLGYQAELFTNPQQGVMESVVAVLNEFGLELNMVNFCAVRNVLLERKMPGTVRFLRQLRPDAVVYCPLICPEAMLAAKLVGVPSASLNTIAGPGACSTSLEATLKQEGLSSEAFVRWVDSFEPDAAAVDRLNERYGLDLKPGVPMPLGMSNEFRSASVNLVTTTEDLQDPVPPELARAYEAEGEAPPAGAPAGVLERVRAARASGRGVVL